MIEQQLFEHLSTFPGLAALVGDRVYPLQVPQEAELPALTFLRVSTVAVQHRSSQTPTFSRARFQVDGWAADFDSSAALRRQIRLAMGAFVQLDFPRVDVALLAGDRDTLEAEPERWRCTLDYMISHQED